MKSIDTDLLDSLNFLLNFYETSLYIFIKIAQESLDLSAFLILFKLIS